MTEAQVADWLNGGWRNGGYVKTINGKQGIDVDGAYGFQCFDFINAFSIWLGMGKISGGYAYQIWNTALANGYTRVDQPKLGDIFVFDSLINGGAGHTGVVRSGIRDVFESVDQNWLNPSLTVGSPPATVVHTSRFLLGFLRSPNIIKENKKMTAPQLDTYIAETYNKIAARNPSDGEFAFHREQYGKQGDVWLLEMVKGFKGDEVAWKKYERNLKDADAKLQACMSESGSELKSGKYFVK